MSPGEREMATGATIDIVALANLVESAALVAVSTAVVLVVTLGAV